MRYGALQSKSAPLPLRGANMFEALPAGYRSLWYTQKRNGSCVLNGKPSGPTDLTADAAADEAIATAAATAEERASSAAEQEQIFFRAFALAPSQRRSLINLILA